MKNHLNAFLIVLLCIVGLLLVSCANREETIEPALNHPDWSEVKLDDLMPLRKILTTKYDLNELTEFFGNKGCHANYIHNEQLLFFQEVNERFPVEVVRPGNYSVYKVRQGGYFYVFWNQVVTENADDLLTIGNEDVVHFTTYLHKEKKFSEFETIIPGVSTAEDVRKIDPYMEMDFLSSCGIFSFSYLNKDEILQVEYEDAVNIDGYEDLIVKNIEIVPKASGFCNYSYILQQDLP